MKAQPLQKALDAGNWTARTQDWVDPLLRSSEERTQAGHLADRPRADERALDDFSLSQPEIRLTDAGVSLFRSSILTRQVKVEATLNGPRTGTEDFNATHGTA